MKLVFMGTPEFAVPSLRTLVETGHTVQGVFTQPDKPKNRGMKLLPSPVKVYASAVQLQVYQPTSLRDGTALACLKELAPDLIVVAAYGKILPPDILSLPRLGCINVHSSLLPRYRGAAPINWAILNGDRETGVTIMHMAEGLDTGDMIAWDTTPIGEDETAPELHDRLAEMGARLLSRAVEALEQGCAQRIPQKEEDACYAPMLSKDLSPMDWERTAPQLQAQVRGLNPWPSAVAWLDGVRCKIWKATVLEEHTEQRPGNLLQSDKQGLKIACGGGTVLRIDELQPDGKKRMSATAFLMGHPISAN